MVADHHRRMRGCVCWKGYTCTNELGTRPLWAKARLYFERAFAESPEDARFGLWCSLGLELLARTALASVSPTLLAEPDNSHKFLLIALNRGSETTERRSIRTSQVFSLCVQLFDGFSKDDQTAAMALINRRNDELHTGAAAFDEYPSKIWLAGFYRTCLLLTEAMGESLESLFGEEKGRSAREVLSQNEKGVKHKVLNEIADRRRKFEEMPIEAQQAARETSEKAGEKLAHERHHRVKCPSCGSVATVQGEPFGPNTTTLVDEQTIEVRQTISPRSFACSTCGLSLGSYAELAVADLGGHHTRTTEFSPEDYYGLIHPDSVDEEAIIDRYLADMASERSWDNE